MHKNFYASGFIYHAPTQQILLQQQTSVNNFPSVWSLFEGVNLYKEDAETAFLRIIYSSLRIKLNPKSIFPVYSYFHKKMNKNHYIICAEIKNLKDFSPNNGIIFAWFTFKQIVKLQLSEQAKHDITVGQRVIDARLRKSLGQKTLE